MADFADLGSAREQQDLELALQQRKPEGPCAPGVCLYCGWALPDGRRWCSASCRDDWEHEHKAGRGA